jgi:hypothetical protein
MTEGVGNRIALNFVDTYEKGFLAGEKDKRDMAHKHDHEGDLTYIGLSETFCRVVKVASNSNVKEHRRFYRITKHHCADNSYDEVKGSNKWHGVHRDS